MSSTNASGSGSALSRVRPVTWAILAWAVIMIALILGAWRGSVSRFGSIPELTVATPTRHVEVGPFRATDLDGDTIEGEPVEFAAGDLETVSIVLPVELQRTALQVYTERGRNTEQAPVAAGASPDLRIPVTTPAGRLSLIEIRGMPTVYSASGEETLLNGAWSVRVVRP